MHARRRKGRRRKGRRRRGRTNLCSGQGACEEERDEGGGPIKSNVWQSRVEIEGYSVAYFDRIAAFKAPYR